MLSVIICTHNRSELLDKCLKSLINQTLPTNQYEVIVIDNNCSDNTAELVKSFQDQFNNIKYFRENKVGLSHARNRGAKEALSDNLLYLDDDILAETNVCEKTYQTFKEKDWAAFGGIYTQWFYYGQPKWYPKTWNTNINDWNKYSELPENRRAIGCVFAIRKKELFNMGGFDPNFGMTGNKIGYGEESDIQNKLRKAGYSIGFNPNIKIKHVIPKHKLNIWWHLRAAWKNQQTFVQINPERFQYPFWVTIKRILFASVKRLKYAKKLTQRNYFWQNFLFDYAEPIIRLIAAFHTTHLKRKNA